MTDANALARRWLAALPTDPSIHLHRFDIKERTAVLARLDEAMVRDAAFLDDRALPPVGEAVVVPLEAALEALGAIAPRPHDAIFHLARCGSTLVSRLLGALPNNLQKREPLPWLSCGIHARFRGADLTPRAFSALFEATSRSLARSFDPRDRVVVKSTSVAASLMPYLLVREPSQRAIALMLPLERWLATVLDDPSSQANVASHAPWWQVDLAQLFPETGMGQQLFLDPDAVSQLYSPGELMALSWCAPMCWFDNAASHYPERTRICNVDQLLEHPAIGLAALSSFLKLDASADQIAAVTDGPIPKRYSKDTEQHFDRVEHTARLADSRERNAEEIAAGLRFAERFASIELIANNLT